MANDTKDRYNGQSQVKKHGLFYSDAVGMSKAFSGIDSINFIGRLIGKSVHSLLHGDRERFDWTAAIPEKDRIILANRLVTEASIFIGFIGMLIPLSCMIFNISNNLFSPFVWILLSLFSFLVGNGLGVMKLWQAYCVRHATPVTFAIFIHHFWHGERHGS